MDSIIPLFVVKTIVFRADINWWNQKLLMKGVQRLADIEVAIRFSLKCLTRPAAKP
jgi:hypothetical protein